MIIVFIEIPIVFLLPIGLIALVITDASAKAFTDFLSFVSGIIAVAYGILILVSAASYIDQNGKKYAATGIINLLRGILTSIIMYDCIKSITYSSGSGIIDIIASVIAVIITCGIVIIVLTFFILIDAGMVVYGNELIGSYAPSPLPNAVLTLVLSVVLEFLAIKISDFFGIHVLSTFL